MDPAVKLILNSNLTIIFSVNPQNWVKSSSGKICNKNIEFLYLFPKHLKFSSFSQKDINNTMEREVMKCVIVMFSNYEAATVSGVLCVYYVNKPCWHKCPRGPAEHYTNVYILAQQFICFTTGKTWFLRNLKKEISEWFILKLTPPCWQVSSFHV